MNTRHQAPAQFSPILDHRGQPMVRNQAPYEGASHSPRTQHWHAPGSGPNRILQMSLATLRHRARAAADRNNPWVGKAVATLVNNEVGTGVTLRSSAEKVAFKEAANALWRQSSLELDPERVLSFGAMQVLAVRTRRVAGEVFIRRRRRSLQSGLAVPMQIQLLEPEYVPHDLEKKLKNGRTIRQGIEFNRQGQRLAYWMHREHPGDGQSDYGKLLRIPADDVIHHYMPIRPGQRRGVSEAAQALVSARTFDEYEDAELERKQTRAPYTGAIYRETYGDEDARFDPYTGAPLDPDAQPMTDVAHGTLFNLQPGEKIDLFDSDKTGDGFGVYARSVLLKIAAGIGVPYELMTGDWKEVNDRLVRAILNAFYRQIEAVQQHLLIDQLCRGIWHWWIDAAIFAGKLSAPGYADNQVGYRALQAHTQGWRYMHPEQDINAKIKARQHHLTSRQEIISDMPGPSMDEIDQQIDEDPYDFPTAAASQKTPTSATN